MNRSQQKLKITIIALITTIMVGLVNTVSAVIAYGLVFPEDQGQGSLISSSETEFELPTPDTSQSTAKSKSSAPSGVQQGSSATTQSFRSSNDALVAGQKPMPGSVITNPDGSKSYKWCTGTNPDLPDEVCRSVVSIVSNPSPSNPYLGQKAKEALSLLPQNTSITMDEDSWEFTGPNSGTMLATARTQEYGDIQLKVLFEKNDGIWVLTDGYAQ